MINLGNVILVFSIRCLGVRVKLSGPAGFLKPIEFHGFKFRIVEMVLQCSCSFLFMNEQHEASPLRLWGGIVTMGDHITEMMSTRHGKPREKWIEMRI